MRSGEQEAGERERISNNLFSVEDFFLTQRTF